MRNRVSPKWKQRHLYYDRGITICKEWDNYLNFKDWALQNGYSKELELDRTDNDKCYYPENCRWVTKKVNNLNKRNTIMVEYLGEKISLIILCERLGFDKKRIEAVRHRIINGMNAYDAIHKKLRNDIHTFLPSIKVIDVKTNIEHPSIMAASRATGIDKVKISRMLRGIQPNTSSLRKV